MDFKIDDDTYVCNCLGITKRNLREFLESGKTIEDIRNETGLGMGCGICIGPLLTYLEFKNKKK